MHKFYQEVSTQQVEGGWTVALDGKPIKTPMKSDLVMPTKALAELVAWEWEAQGTKILPDSMPLTKLANTAIDRVAARHKGVADEVAAYGGSDLICYRAEEPDTLVKKQEAAWDPYLEWVRSRYDLSLETTTGIMPIAQSEATKEGFKAIVRAMDPFTLTACHELTSGFGSLVLALAYIEGQNDFESLWAISRTDENHQIEEWGEDPEESDVINKKRADLMLACQFYETLKVDRST